jgi:hypothetical protein
MKRCGDYRALHPPIQCLRVAAVRLVIEHPFPEQSPRTMGCIVDHKTNGRRTLPVQAGITGSTRRLILQLDSSHLRARRAGARAYAFPYCGSSSRSSSAATLETVPVICPVSAKKTGLLEASANTGFDISVNVRMPDAFLKRPVPPVI